MYRTLKYFLLGFLVGYALILPGFMIGQKLESALFSALVFAFAYGLFSVGFMVRSLAAIELTIDRSNMDPQKGLRWYEDLIREQLKDMRFRYSETTQEGKEIFKPTGLYQVLEGPLELTISAYDIHLKCSRMMMRILTDLVEIHQAKFR